MRHLTNFSLYTDTRKILRKDFLAFSQYAKERWLLVSELWNWPSDRFFQVTMAEYGQIYREIQNFMGEKGPEVIK